MEARPPRSWAGGRPHARSVGQARNSETRRDRIYGCWTTTGRRFTLFLQRDFGLDLMAGAKVTQLAVSANARGFGARLYYTADTSLKTVVL